MDRDLKPSEKEESEIYFKMSEAVKPEKVIIRLLDIGADKEIKYIKQQKEDNPALGLRGVRLMLSDNELIRSQLKAIITANKNSNIKIMAPMISAVEEVVKLRQIFNEICDEIKKENSSINTDIPLGIMIETPSAAVIADKFAEVSDFFSIGTNDLVQYVMASDRVNENVMNTYQTYNPAVWKLIENISKAGSKRSKEVGVCGEAGSVFGCIILFIGAGIRKLSVSPSKILKIREMISKITVKEAESVFKKAIRMSTAKEVEDMVNRFLIKKGYK